MPRLYAPKAPIDAPARTWACRSGADAVTGDDVVPHVEGDEVLEPAERGVEVQRRRLAQPGPPVGRPVRADHHHFRQPAGDDRPVEPLGDLQEARLVLVQPVQPDHQRVALGRVVPGRDVHVGVAPLAQRRGVDPVVGPVVGRVVIDVAGQPGVQLAEVHRPVAAAAERQNVRGDSEGDQEGEAQTGSRRHVAGCETGMGPTPVMERV